MHLAVVVMLHWFPQIGIQITGPHINEYVAVAAVMIALLLLRRLRKRVCVRCAARINRSADACPRCGVPHPFTLSKVESRKQP